MNDLVEDAWLKLLTTAGEHTRPASAWPLEPFTELVRAAYAEPSLRQLYPWTGMWELHLSRCTGQRWTWDIPYVAPLRDGRFRIEGPLRGQRIGDAASAPLAVAMVVERLPPNCGPAFVGTPEELAAHERAGDNTK